MKIGAKVTIEYERPSGEQATITFHDVRFDPDDFFCDVSSEVEYTDNWDTKRSLAALERRFLDLHLHGELFPKGESGETHRMEVVRP